MAKKLIYNSTFTPGAAGAGTIVITGNYPLKVFQLITNVTDGIILFNFADPARGGTAVYEASTNTTTLTLEYDTSSMSASDSIQIFLDKQEQKVDFSETFTDPVSKLRVSNPQNLIDTDFEYGLQPTKWETVELVNNVPSFFASNSTYSIADVSTVTTIENSDNITVTTQQAHGLTVGAPIDVQGLTSRTAEGKFLVTSVISTTEFVYKAKTVQGTTGAINGSYTVITPGEFYSGADIEINPVGGIETDGATKSSITLNTDYHHGFGRGSSLYFTNTIGSKKITISQSGSATAPDGRPYVDFTDTQTTTVTTNPALTETKQMTGTYAHKFTSSDVNTSDNTILWPGHGLQSGDVVLYVPSSGDTHIGGLQRFQIYYVKAAVSADKISLCETTGGNYSGNSTINFTSQGTSTYGRHQLIFGYEIREANKNSNRYDIYFKTRYNRFGSGSGHDMTEYTQDSTNNRYGYYGKGGKFPPRYLFVSKTGLNPNSGLIYSSMAMYSTSRNSNFTFNKSGTVPDGYDFIEDFEKFNANSSMYNYATGKQHTSHYYYSRTNSEGSIRIYYIGWFDYSNSYNQTYNAEDLYFFMLQDDPERDTIYSAGHGFESGAGAIITTQSGSNISRRTDTGQYMYTTPTFSNINSGGVVSLIKVSDDRLRVAQRIRSAAGTYTIQGSIASPTKDSFYFAGHDLVDKQKLTFSTTGTVPSTTSGASIPTINSLDSVFDAAQSALNTLKTDMGSDHTPLVIQGSQPYYPFQGYTNYNSGVQYFYYSTSSMYIYAPDTGQSARSQYFYNSDATTKLTSGKAWDPFLATNLGGLGYYYASTPWPGQNNTVDFWMEMWQVPDLSKESKTRTSYYASGWKYHYGINGQQGNENNTFDTSLGDGWRFTYESNYFQPQGTNGYHGMLVLGMVIDNSNWPGYYSSQYAQSWYFYSDRYMYGYESWYGGQRYQMKILIPIKAGSTASKYGTSGSFRSTNAIATAIATNIKTTLTQPTLAQGIVYANPINANRFSLKTANNIPYNLTNSGTTPFTFESEELTGMLDGYYSVDTVTDTTIGNFSKFEIPKRTIGISTTEVQSIGSDIYFAKPNYKMKTTQKLVYTENGGRIPGLTPDTTYYTISDGPDHFRLAASIEDAQGGNPISIGTTVAGNFTLTTPSISGTSAGIGTIGITSTSTKVRGFDTLFKRFLRTGDRFRIKDDATNPPTYRDFTVASVIDDTELSIDQAPGTNVANGKYYIDSKVNTRPDGSFLHRPFDGGVEIDAGTSPKSSIVRQTRKYFRYQSGKGIQCSVAINFNPSRLINNIVGVANTVLPSQQYTFDVNNNGSGTYNISGNDRDGRVLGENSTIVVTKGDIITIDINASGHPLWIKTNQSTGTGNAVTTGISNNGDDVGTIVWDTTNITAGTYYYNCQNHASMFGQITVESANTLSTVATATTKYPHGLTRTSNVTIKGAADAVFNGTFPVKAFTEFTFSYYLPSAPNVSVPDGIIEYNIDSWANSAVRCGLFDYQNGMFYEFDGQVLYAVRRSSVQQISGTVNVIKDSNIVTGRDTNLAGQLSVGQHVVIRGGSYKITNLASKTEMHIQPAYKGVTASDVIATKTVDTKVPQHEWNIDKGDGSGPSGFILDMTKIQMAYIDYSWYGAGKVRFGFKDANGHVKYMHEFLHNNVLEEAYMRSGNMPGRYEIENTSETLPTYVPSLFHWGTSVIMDGKFDDDKAYLFTASSNTLNFTNGDSSTATPNGNSYVVRYYSWSNRQYDFYVRIPFASSHADKFSQGVSLYTTNGELDGQEVDFTQYSGNSIFVHIYIGSSRSYYGTPAIYPSVTSSDTVSIGAPAAGSGDDVDLQNEVPLISIRLAPSVDNNLTGALGQREIVNRMQLQLKQLGITLSHDCTVDLILNGEISNRSFVTVTNPSLSELVKHPAGDRVIGGTKIFSLRASGGQENAAGTKRLSATSDFDISQISDLGNSILGGDGTFPNGPDILTIAIRPIDTSDINATTPLKVSSRITWTESQA